MLFRHHACFNLHSCVNTLESLAKLVCFDCIPVLPFSSQKTNKKNVLSHVLIFFICCVVILGPITSKNDCHG